MATKQIKVSDLTGEEISEDNLARIVVEEHPSITDAVTLEVLPEEVEDRLPEVAGYVRVSYYPSANSGGKDQRFVMTLEEFNNLSQDFDMEAVLEDALQAQRKEERTAKKQDGGQKRPKGYYTSPEHVGEPHQGRVSAEEKAYVQEHLDEVNARLERDNLRTIDPSDPQLAERYGLEVAT